MEELIHHDAEAVVLTGSYAREEANDRSDVDLIAIGVGRSRLRMHDDLLISESWTTVEEVRRMFHSPGDVGTAIPGWRRAIVLHDPNAIAADLKREAEDWTWETLDDLDDYVAATVTGFAEEAFRLVGHVERGESRRAAVQRSVMALQLAAVMAVHHRLLYETENRLWDLVCDVTGREWAKAQDAALSIRGEDVAASADAALTLYRLVSERVAPLLSVEQRRVVTSALRLTRSHTS